MNIQVHFWKNSSRQVPTHCRVQLFINFYASLGQFLTSNSSLDLTFFLCLFVSSMFINMSTLAV